MTYSIISNENEKASTIIDAFVISGLVKSRLEARRLIIQGGLYLNDVKVINGDAELNTDNLIADKYMILRKGKREYFLLQFNLLKNK